MSQGWSCMWATEPAPLKHWGRAGGCRQQQCGLLQQCLHTLHPLSLFLKHNTHSLASLLLQDKLFPQQDVLFLWVPMSTPLILGQAALACASSCVCFPTSNLSMHAPFMEQTKIVFWVRPDESLSHKHTLELWAWEMYHSCLQWAEGTV